VDGDALRARLAGGRPVVLAGVFDALSARLAYDAGLDSLFVSGFAVAATLLGKPDFGYVTQTEMADVARRVCSAVPGADVVVDGDTGYGNALNVIRTVELYEQAGAAGVFLEDQEWPKKCGHMAGKRVVPRDDWLAKLDAALDHRDRMFVVARTDAIAAVGIDEACARAAAAHDLGVDAVFVEAPESDDHLRAIVDATPGAVRVANMVEGGRTQLRTPDELHALGFDLVASPLSGLLSATKAMGDAYGALREHGTLRDRLDTVTGFDEFGDLIGLPRHYALEAAYRGDGDSSTA
jgi:2-methylisocitrate lyase-like PEP mutase family enzyme